jgi:mRNA-degrading endonuclease RelE of RelBE toxin-antitoxin system
MAYRISLTESAKQDLGHFDVHDQRIIVAAITTHLRVGAEVSTQKKKPLQQNPISPWELRIDRFRVFYSVEKDNEVKVVAVGHKEHNVLFIRGKKVAL